MTSPLVSQARRATRTPHFNIANPRRLCESVLMTILAPRSRIGRSKPVALGSFVVLVNIASVHAALDVIRGRRIERWVPTRSAPPSDDGAQR